MMFNYLQSKDKKREKYQELFDAATVHTRGLPPENLLKLRRPSEPDDIREYRLSVYEPITKADFQRAITDVKRAVFTDKARIFVSDRLKAVFEAIEPGGVAFMQWVRDFVIPRMFEDANGCIVWWPVNAGKLSEMLVLEPLLMFSFDFEEKEPGLLRWKSGETEKGEPIYFLVDKNAYWAQTGDGEKAKTELIYQHDLGYLPAVENLGGFPAIDEDGLNFLESYFCSAFAWGNKAIRQDSDLEGAKTITAYPVREIQEEPCQNQGCMDGQIYDHATNEKRACGVCGGKGVFIPSGPFAYIVKRKGVRELGEQQTSEKALDYITPPVENLRFLAEDFENTYAKMQKALNQFKPELTQSGAAKKIDLESKDASIDDIAENVWKNIIYVSYVIVRDLVFFRNPQAETIELYLPETFRIKTESDLLNEVLAARQNGERMLSAETAKELLLKKFGDNPEMQKAVEFLSMYDPLFGMTTAEKMDMATAGTGTALGYTDADFIRAGKGFQATMRAVKEPGFMEMDYQAFEAFADKFLNIE